jgi:hypothetical protein
MPSGDAIALPFLVVIGQWAVALEPVSGSAPAPLRCETGMSSGDAGNPAARAERAHDPIEDLAR